MNKKLISLLVAMLLFGSVLLVACGGETAEPTQAPQATEEVAEEPTEEVVEEPTKEVVEEPTASITIWADDTRAPILTELAEGFKAAYNVNVVVEQVANMRDDFKIAAPAGEGPHILIGAHDWIGELIASGLLAPIDLGDKAGEFRELALQGFTYEGQLYGMPYATENIGFFRNTELVPEAPATWDEVVEIATALEDAGTVDYGFTMPAGATYDGFPVQTAFGGYIFGRDANGNYDPNDLGINSEGMIAAGQWMADQIAAGHLTAEMDWETMHTLFQEGRVAMIMAGPWALDRIRESGVPYAISPFPAAAQPGQPFAGVQGFMINALKDPGEIALAQAFLVEFVATEEVMEKLQTAGNRPSAFTAVYDKITDPDLLAFGEAGADAYLMPAIPAMSQVWTAWGNALTLIFQGQVESAAAFEEAATQIKTAIEGQ